MKIISIKISNVLSFKYVDNIDDATTLIFNQPVSIIIGENGSGKSTLLEVINFIFKKVVFEEVLYKPQYLSGMNMNPGE